MMTRIIGTTILLIALLVVDNFFQQAEAKATKPPAAQKCKAPKGVKDLKALIIPSVLPSSGMALLVKPVAHCNCSNSNVTKAFFTGVTKAGNGSGSVGLQCTTPANMCIMVKGKEGKTITYSPINPSNSSIAMLIEAGCKKNKCKNLGLLVCPGAGGEKGTFNAADGLKASKGKKTLTCGKVWGKDGSKSISDVKGNSLLKKILGASCDGCSTIESVSKGSACPGPSSA